MRPTMGVETRNLLLEQQNRELVLAPARIALAQGQDAIGQAGRPGGLAVPVRAGRARFQGKQVQRIIAALRAVESLAPDPEMPASTGHILRAAAEVHPLSADFRFPAQLFPRARTVRADSG